LNKVRRCVGVSEGCVEMGVKEEARGGEVREEASGDGVEERVVDVCGGLTSSYECEGVEIDGVKKVLRENGSCGSVGVVGVLAGVVGSVAARRAEILSLSKEARDLSCKLPYSAGKGKGLSRGEEVKWKPLGKVGRIEVSDEVFERCCERKEDEEMAEGDLPSIEEELRSYGFSEELSRMFEWYEKEGFGELCEEEPNTGVYVKVKPDGSKLQVISDRSAANLRDRWKPRSFRMFRAGDVKRLLRTRRDVFFFSFDVSNFFHSFVVPELMRKRVPTIYRKVDCEGAISAIEAGRLVFGSWFSPVVSHVAACDFLGLKDTVFSRCNRDWRKELSEEVWCEEDGSGIYVDDFLEASCDLEKAGERYRWKRRKFEEAGCGIKESSIIEGVQALEFAGKAYCGKASCPRIGNTEKNKTKIVALLMVVERIGLTRDLVESLVGSISFIGSLTGWCFPFLNRCSCFVRGVDFPHSELRSDLICALAVALIPWTPFSQFRWDHGFEREKHVFVDAQNDFGRFGVVWFLDGAWRFISCTIPKKFCGSQQCAELYGVKKAIGMALDKIGWEFVIVSDSVGSLEVLCRMKMATKSWRRNQILRSMVKDWIGKEFLIHVLWVPSEFNPADEGSRRSEPEGRFEGLFEGGMEKVFESGVCLSRSEFYCRGGPGTPERSDG
jgi:hypothetical protein